VKWSKFLTSKNSKIGVMWFLCLFIMVFHYHSVNLEVIWYLTIYIYIKSFVTCGLNVAAWECLHTIRGACGPPSSQKYHFTVSFKVLLHPLLVGAVRGGGGVVCCRWIFFFSFFFSLIPEKLHLNRLCCWYFNFNSYSFDFYINIKSMPTRSHLVSAWIDSCPKVGLFFIPILSNWKRLTFLFLVLL